MITDAGLLSMRQWNFRTLRARSSQYTADDYQATLRETHVLIMMESFFSTLRAELTELAHFRTRAEARTSLFEFIEGFYNRQRLHSALGYHSPADFEAQWLGTSCP